MSTHRGMHIYP